MAGPQPQRRLRCIIIGAGVSGILIGDFLKVWWAREQTLTHIAAIKLRETLKDKVDFWILEKNEDVGGTWFENRYPGCACDVPSHIYQYSFCPNPYWSTFYASSAEIRSYLKAVVYHYGINEYISFKHSVNKAVWNENRGKWTVSVAGQGAFECDILINASGILNHIQHPNLKNLGDFQGLVLHSAAWNEDTDLRGKRVAIIGAGASAIQLLPAIQKDVEHVDIYIRTPSWITPPPLETMRPARGHDYTSGEKQKFRDDPEYSVKIRKEMESSCNKLYKAFIKSSDEQRDIRRKLEESMKSLLADAELQENLIPTFEVGCRRVNPGEPYLEALQKPNVQPIFDSIDEVTPHGIVAAEKLRLADIIIAATGFDTSFRPRFPIIGQKDIDLRERWKDDPVAYFGLAVSGFPNYLMFLGPNTPISNGSLMGTLEATADYFVRLIEKFIHEKAMSFNVRCEVQADFDAHTQNLMEDMVWTGTCRSWYKNKSGKVTALWPGSSLHYREILESNRWEDFVWQYQGNRFSYWGQGFARVETSDSAEPGDLAYYIRQHEPLPLEAYYLSAKASPGRPRIGHHFRHPVEADKEVEVAGDSGSESSWESKIVDPRTCEAAGFSV
ncbi:uncharacterized protein Z518_05102 [Rhinocladiella mackenziei CBS 650.93]|uniref:L-ornithine N(5)-oxygenase n=1 Tax=Rhinocladiella mackenziei CBS 650.93 TaxID=1442369 RepID=A0A0D2JD89_9EURO|nr:uncharacterized protein Z518_05102 [Rhinocladiella mackenziei CBS 650.93]KIX07125.1 hypothetical protein Z518_05102 [Rhinocladiella mackenziei CBS 650.93]